MGAADDFRAGVVMPVHLQRVIGVDGGDLLQPVKADGGYIQPTNHRSRFKAGHGEKYIKIPSWSCLIVQWTIFYFAIGSTLLY